MNRSAVDGWWLSGQQRKGEQRREDRLHQCPICIYDCILISDCCSFLRKKNDVLFRSSPNLYKLAGWPQTWQEGCDKHHWIRGRGGGMQLFMLRLSSEEIPLVLFLCCCWSLFNPQGSSSCPHIGVSGGMIARQ